MSAIYDFSGWATRANLKCSDGRTILKDAFKSNDGQTVPLVWNHQHNDSFNVLGHALLENRDDGVYAYCTFNETESGKNAKLLVEHGDVCALSIWANELKQQGANVLHGAIKEVSLVLAGANPGAFIDSVICHGESSDDEAIIYTGEPIVLHHSDTDDEEKKEETKDTSEDGKKENGKTLGEVFDSLNEEQKNVVYAMLGMALEEGESEQKASSEEDDDKKNNESKEGGDNTMKHNVFDNDQQERNVLSHADMSKIIADGKKCGSLRDAVLMHQEEGGLLHGIDTTGMDTATGTQTYGFNDPDMLFPDYKSLNNPPEWIKRQTDWVATVMNGVHRSPFSRIKSVYANITEDEARAKGYIKGKQKKEEVFTTLKRTTDPQTIYKKQKLDRDDVIDITDFDVVAWIKAEMRVMLEEEIARAILIGDGRQSDSDDKIQEAHIRPIAKDVPLFNVKVTVDETGLETASAKAKAFIDSVIRSRKKYKGSGNPTLFTTEDQLTECLLIEDEIGHKIYKSEAELATALRVSKIVTVEVMEGQTIDDLELLGVIVNLTDYNVGADKGGEVSLFDDFDIDYNQMKYLIETRISGALIKPYSAMTILRGKTTEAAG